MGERNEDLENRFNYHPATGDKPISHEQVRDECLTIAYLFDIILPDGREKAVAITKLEEAMFWANAAIARND